MELRLVKLPLLKDMIAAYFVEIRFPMIFENFESSAYSVRCVVTPSAQDVKMTIRPTFVIFVNSTF